MPKYKLIKRIGTYALLGTLSLSNPLVVTASSKNAEKEEKGILDYFEQIDEKISEIGSQVGDAAKDLEVWDPESLWLITTVPDKSPEEERDYFFVYKEHAKFKWTYYYDEYGHTISSSSNNRSKAEIREMYILSSEEDQHFTMETWLDYQTQTFTLNYIDLDQNYLYDEQTTADYGRITDFTQFLPPEEIKEEYSTKELTRLLDEYFNNMNYSLESSQNLTLRK